MPTVTLTDLQTILDAQFGGVLDVGAHAAGEGHCCGLELLSVAEQRPWSDDPQTLDCWDVRSLHDIAVSPALRTRHMLPLLVAYQHSRSWPIARQLTVAERLVVLTIQRLISALPGLSPDLMARCRGATTLEAAATAARAAAAATWAAEAATLATWAAEAATWATWGATLAARSTALAATFAARATARAARATARAARATARAAAAAESLAVQAQVFLTGCALWLEAASASWDDREGWQC
jgi:hypothetical protein